jgi:hypothetical protein
MLTLETIQTIEDGADTEYEYYSALQKAINSGTAWKMQGSYGRAMMGAIEDGRCMLGRNHARDYWGSRIPARSEVKEGTKGSVSYVRHMNGDRWADMMEAL